MAGRFQAFYSHLPLQRAQGRQLAARRALPVIPKLGAHPPPDDDLGDRPDEVPVLKRPAETPAPRTPDEIAPPTRSHIPLPGRTTPTDTPHIRP